MSNLNERAYLKGKFKHFGATSNSATKNAVMAGIQKKKRKKRFFIIFFLSAFAIAIGTVTTMNYTAIDSNKVREIKTSNSKNSDKKSIKHASTKSNFQNDKVQMNPNEGKSLAKDKMNNQGMQKDHTQDESKSIQSNKVEANNTVLPNQDNAISEKNSSVNNTHTNKPSEQKSQNLANKTSQNTEDQEEEEMDQNDTVSDNESKVDELNIKSISLPRTKQEPYKLNDYNTTSSAIKKSKWIIGLSYSYNQSRLNNTKDKQVVAPEILESYNPSNPPNDPIVNQELFRIKRSMNLELSATRKFKNKFYLQSGLRYTSLNSFTSTEKMKDHLIGIPLMVGYNVPLKSRWALDFSTGINYNISIAKSMENIESKSKSTTNNFFDFHMSTAELRVGLSYFMNEKLSINLSPQISYLIYYEEQTPIRYCNNKIWLGGQFGLFFHLK